MTFSAYKEGSRPLYISLETLNINEISLYFTAMLRISTWHTTTIL